MTLARRGHRSALGAAVTVWLAVQPVAGQYMIQELEGLPNAVGINNAGQVIGNDYDSAFLWTEGAIIELGTLGGAKSQAKAINNAGQVVGWSSTTETAPGSSVQLERAFLWLPAPTYGLPAGMNNLGTLGGGYHSYANDLNDVGQIVGESRPTGSAYMHAFIWQNGVMTDIGTFSSLDTISEANGINNLGQVVGWSFDEDIVTNAFLWDAGQMTDLGDLGGLSFNGPLSVAQRINDNGQVIGHSIAAPAPGDAQNHAFLWETGQMTDLNQLGGYLRTAAPAGINNAGDVVGSTDAHGAVLWRGGKMIVLKDAVNEPGWSFVYATDINDHGQIVGWGKNPAGQTRSFLLTPDCNNSGIADFLEGRDINSSGVPDECDPDCNGNGTPDDLDVELGASADINANGIPDECNELGDCNGNGAADYLDLADGSSEDRNANYLPDECELHGAIYVDAAAAGAEVQDGSAEHPFATIRQAIDLSFSGDEIVLAPGIYTGLGNRGLRFDGRSITIRSTDPANPAIVASTIVDAEQADRLFSFDGQETATAVLDGLTLRNGKPIAVSPLGSRGGAIFIHNSSPTIRNCVMTNCRAGMGGAIDLEYSHATISNCTIADNDNNVPCYECGGGGIAVNLFSSPTIVGCTISSNGVAGYVPGGGILSLNNSSPSVIGCTIDGNLGGQGGGIHSDGSAVATVTDSIITNNTASDGGGIFGVVTMSNCTIADNVATHDGGGMWGSGTLTDCLFIDNTTNGSGGGLRGSGTLTACSFVDNSAGYSGGGIWSSGAVYLTDCDLRGNSASFSGGGMVVRGFFDMLNCTISGNVVTSSSGSGGGIMGLEANGTKTLTNCVVSGNAAGWGGGIAVTLGSGPLSLTNCTVAGNTATTPGPDGGGAILAQSFAGVVQVQNSILWGNVSTDGDQIRLYDSDLQVTYSNVEGGTSTIDIAPAPAPPSNVIWGAGNVDADPYFVDAAGADGQVGTDDDDLRLSAGSPSIDAADNAVVPAAATLDPAGAPRFLDDPNTPDTGNGAAPIVDMGAFEFVPAVAIVTANPPLDNPYLDGQQPFVDVLDTGPTSGLTAGIGAAGTFAQGPITYGPISVTFVAAPFPAPSTANVSVACTGGPPCPSVTSVAGSGAGPYEITLSAPIPPGQCTTLTFVGTVAGVKLQYQSQPANVSMDGLTNTQDLLALIQALNNGAANQPANLARYNMNRSTGANPVNTQDLLRLIQLLNGTLTTEPFNGDSVAACP